MLLDLIIPQYKEDDNIVKNLLDSNKLKSIYDNEIINQNNKYNIDNVYKDINDFNNSFFK